jgi:Tfp pilus assembly protein PilF
MFLDNLRGYHAFNLAIHMLAGLALFGVLRRTLESVVLADRFGNAATALAAAIALLWLVHPLHTASVTYLVQRAEALMGLCFLVTLYAAIRAHASANRLWSSAAIVACALGMGAKETMVGAPLAVIAWDWFFAVPRSQSFRPVWARRWRLYAALAACWLILAWTLSSDPRAGAAGFGFAGWPWWRYLATQAGVILHYLRLSVVPSPLVLDYGWPAALSLAAEWPRLVLVGALAALSIGAAITRHPAGFPGVWFFLILAPTSSVLPIVTEVAAEHRMYLPLAAVVALVTALAFAIGRRAHIPWPVGAAAVGIAASILAMLTVARNADYTSEERIWRDTVRKRPANPRGHINYAVVLAGSNRAREAEPHLRAALTLAPNDADAHLALGAALCSTGRCAEGITNLRRASELDPDNPDAAHNLAEAHASFGRTREAAAHFRRALVLAPDNVFLLNQASWLLATAPEDDVRDGRSALALAERAVSLTSRRDAVSLDSLAVAYAELNRFAEATAVAGEALVAARTSGPPALTAELEQHRTMFETGQRIRRRPAGRSQ